MVLLQEDGRRQMVLLTTYLMLCGNLVVSIGLAPQIQPGSLTHVLAWLGQQNVAILVLTQVSLILIATASLVCLHVVTTVGARVDAWWASAVTEGLIGGLFGGSLVFLAHNIELLLNGGGIL